MVGNLGLNLKIEREKSAFPIFQLSVFLDFSHDGLRLIASGDDDSMIVYDCEKVVIQSSDASI